MVCWGLRLEAVVLWYYVARKIVGMLLKVPLALSHLL